MTTQAPASHDPGQIARYIVNGLVATGVHYGVLSACLELLHFGSAGQANLVAACFGITASFFGSRHFVFRRPQEPVGRQALRFGALYVAIAALHGLVLTVWTDVLRLDYRWGFVLATGLQVSLSYWGNKRLVFNPPTGKQP
ncbi:MAG: GtrA-like protein [Ramlibacter sp.]|jgi:putative flippase GtrA|nr:GtrA-like protein [Ramlibacter sp.]